MSKIQPVRGTHDLFDEALASHNYICETLKTLSTSFGYTPIETPIFEFTHLFSRSVGESSDIVSKEMYSFVDRGGEAITLRPEGTASVVRALLSNSLTQSLPLKFFYMGPMFRYERPQKGRMRQFKQFGVEFFGVPSPLADVETISLGFHVLQALGLKDHIALEINTLGDQESRTLYREKLVAYFSAYEKDLSEDSQRRLKTNPLRILDSKDDGDRKIIDGAPLFADCLNTPSKDFFDAVRRGLDALGHPYTHNPRLVRGLDYYCHTAFEFIGTNLGAQSTVLAGGRYDGLVEELGGPSIPAVGWALGVDRLALMLDKLPPKNRPLIMIPMDDAYELKALEIANFLRKNGYLVEMTFSGNVGKRMKRANKIMANYALVLGENEFNSGTLALKNLDLGTQSIIPQDDLLSTLKELPL